MKWLLVLVVLAIYLLHQDYWNWGNKTLVFGFLPVGLAYHAGFAFLAAFMMWMLVKFAWPEQLERDIPESVEMKSEDGH